MATASLKSKINWDKFMIHAILGQICKFKYHKTFKNKAVPFMEKEYKKFCLPVNKKYKTFFSQSFLYRSQPDLTKLIISWQIVFALHNEVRKKQKSK